MSENPYQAPLTEVESPRNTTIGQGRPPSPYGNWREIKVSGYILQFATLVYILFQLGYLSVELELSQLENGSDHSFLENMISMDLYELSVMLSSIDLGLLISIGVVWFFWILPSAKNGWLILSKRDPQYLEGRQPYTPGWCFGWFLVPIMSMWKPYQAQWFICDASCDPEGPDMKYTVVIWWSLHILAGTIGIMNTFIYVITVSEEPHAISIITTVMYHTLFMAALAMDLILIRKLTTIQYEQARLLKLR